jgi:toxin ParE1/3/4
MPFKVLLTNDAAADIEAIYDYVALYDGEINALSLLEHFEALIASLVDFPEHGAYPKELLALGIREYRQLNFKPYRMIYRVIGNTVYIYLVADGRRDMQSLLCARLLST